MIATPFSRENAQERSGGVWSYVSASRLNSWLACPLKFRLKYIDGVREPPSLSLFLGKVVHHGLELHYRHRLLGEPLEAGDAARRMLAGWDELAAREEMHFASVADECRTREQAAELLLAYLRHVPSSESPPLAVEVAVETPLVDLHTGESLGLPLVGVIDLVLAELAGPLIADFKTAARATDPLEISHEIQLSCYAYLFRRTAGVTESGLEIRNIIKTKLPQIQFHRYAARDEQQFRRLFAVIRAYLDSLDAGRYVYRPGRDCSFCNFRDLQCRQWSG